VYENAKREYEGAKARYLMNETFRKNEKKKKYIIATIILFLFSISFFFSLFPFLTAPIGIMFLIIAGICGYMAYKTAKKDVIYDVKPPQEGIFPDKYGLGIEMNSNYSVIFTAIGDDGVQSLRELQEEINEADTKREITVFNMNENHISVENNEGIINTGDNANNNVE
jgi:hypothetical protein